MALMNTKQPWMLFLMLFVYSCTTPSRSRSISPTWKNSNSFRNLTIVCDPSRFANLGLDMSTLHFCDKSLPYAVRAKDLIDRMTLDEKVAQLGNTAQGVKRLGVPRYEWWSESLHGVASTGFGTWFDNIVPGATSFPEVILMAASFNESPWKAVGQAVSTEARAMYNVGHAGLTFWSPNINVVRDPRWGRTLETPGEDPFTIGRYAVNYVRGLQDVAGREAVTDDPNSRPLKIASCCKHYAAYDVDNWSGYDRVSFDARVTEQDMVETFLAPFETCVKEGDVASVMCSYNRVNGIPTCADPKLLNETIRGDWNLHGYIVSDCDSVKVMVENHKFLQDTKEDAVAQAFNAGLDLDCGQYYPDFTKSAVLIGRVREKALDNALNNLYIVLMRLGFFDGNPLFNNLGILDICSNQNIQLAKEAATQGIVLLKNNNTVLPLNSLEMKSYAVVGPHANATTAMIGNYAGVPCQYTSPLKAFSSYGKVMYEPGCSDILCSNDTFISPAVQAAKEADVTIIFAGLDLSVEREGQDRVDLLLPGFQTEMINQVANEARGAVVLVLMSAGGVDISFAQSNPNVKAILWAGYPGEEGGSAIADVIHGRFNPGGRLPITWFYNDYVDKLPMTSMRLRPVSELNYPGRTYKFFDGSVLYPFGYGMSYTKFSYNVVNATEFLQVQLNHYAQCKAIMSYDSHLARPSCPGGLVDDMRCLDEISITVEVKNTGAQSGSDVVMVYSRAPLGISGAPIKQLIGFQRVHVITGKSTIVSFKINACKGLSIVDTNAYRVLPYGQHTIIVGNGDGAVSFPLHVKINT